MSLLDPPVRISPRITSVVPALVAGVSSTSHPTILGIASPLSLVSLYLNGTIVGTTFADAAGMWSVALPAQLNGSVNLVARSVPASNVVTMTINDPKQPLQNAAGTPAVFDMDNESGLFYTNSTVYADQSSLLGAIGATVSGVTASFGGYVNPQAKNVIVNGTFYTDTSSWSNINGVTSSIISGEAVIDYTPAATGAFTQTITGYSGRAFAFTSTSRRGTNTGNSPSVVGTLSNAALGGNLVGIPAVTATNVTGTFYMASASGAGMFVGMRGNTGGGTAILDNVSGIEAMPCPGWGTFATTSGVSAPAFSVVVDAVAPNTLPASGLVKVIWQGDVNTTHDILRIHWASDGSIHLYGTTNSSSLVVDLNLGNVAPGARFKVAIGASAGVNADPTTGYAGSLNGKNAPNVFASNLVMVGVSHMRIGTGGGQAGTAVWDGTFNRVAVIPGRQQNDWLEFNATLAGATPRWFAGDSYIGGAGGVILPDLYETAVNKITYNTGVGGSTFAKIRDDIIARPYLRNLPLIIWDGSNNGMIDVATQIAIAQQIWDWKADSRILFIPSIAVPNPATASGPAINPNGTYMRQYRDALISTFGASHVYDPVPIIQGLSTGSADDLNDIASGVIPRSTLLTQNNAEVHLSTAAMTAVAQHSMFQAKIAAL
jgi:hypothetical protein